MFEMVRISAEIPSCKGKYLKELFKRMYSKNNFIPK